MRTNYVLIDYENVQPDDFDLLDQEWIKVFVFADRVSKIEDIPALASNRILSKPIGEKVALVRDRLAKSTGNRPRSRKTLTSHVAAMFLKSLPKEELTSVVDALMSEGVFRENGKRIEYADE